MKLTLGILAGFLLTLSSFAQGTVTWNSPTLITTNDLQGTTGPISGVDHYRFGLYIGPSGAPRDSLMLAGLTTNNPAIPGRFTSVPNLILPLFPNGQQISFQVRGWSLFAGTTYEDARNYALADNSPLAYLGESGVGAYIVGSIVPLQSANFELTPIPEPSSIILGTVGLILVFLLGQRRARVE